MQLNSALAQEYETPVVMIGNKKRVRFQETKREGKDDLGDSSSTESDSPIIVSDIPAVRSQLGKHLITEQTDFHPDHKAPISHTSSTFNPSWKPAGLPKTFVTDDTFLQSEQKDHSEDEVLFSSWKPLPIQGSRPTIMSKTTYCPFNGAFISSSSPTTIDSDRGLKPPLMSKYSPSAFLEFIDQYQIYVMQGGKCPIERCVKSDIWRLAFAYRAPDQQSLTGFPLLQKQLGVRDGKAAFLQLTRAKLLSPLTFESWNRFTAQITQALTVTGPAIRPYLPAICRDLVQKAASVSTRLGEELSVMEASGNHNIYDYLYTGHHFLEQRHTQGARSTQGQADHTESSTERSAKRCKIHGAGHSDAECRVQHPELRKPRREGTHKQLETGIKEQHSAHFTIQLNTPDGQRLHALALADTGSCFNIISPAFADEIQSLCPEMKRSHNPVTIIHGKDSRTKADESLEIKVTFPAATLGKPLIIPLEFIISAIVGDDQVIIGRDTLLNHNLIQFNISRPTDSNLDKGDLKKATSSPAQNEELRALISTDCSFKKQLLETLEKFSVVFEETLPKEGAKLPPFHIDLVDEDQFTASKARYLSPPMKKIVSDRIKELLDAGIIRPSESNFASPIVIVKKRTGEYRMCVDYTLLNLNTRPLPYPIPFVEEILGQLADYSWFATLDLRSGFHQIKVKDDSIHKTAFVTHEGLFEFLRIPFGCKNSPTFFQMQMSRAFRDLRGKCCHIFIDDIVIFGKTIPEFIENLTRVMQRIMDLNLRVKGPKCIFGANKLEYLGREISSEGIRVARSRVTDILELKHPTNIRGIRQICGLFNHYKKYIKGYAEIIEPIQAMLRTKHFNWTPACEESYNTLKQILTARPILAHIDYAHPIYLQTDASDVGVGGILLQEIGEEQRTICFISRTLTATERRWTTNEKEMFAIKYCVDRCEQYLRGLHQQKSSDGEHSCPNSTIRSNSLADGSERIIKFMTDVVITMENVAKETIVLKEECLVVGNRGKNQQLLILKRDTCLKHDLLKRISCNSIDPEDFGVQIRDLPKKEEIEANIADEVKKELTQVLLEYFESVDITKTDVEEFEIKLKSEGDVPMRQQIYPIPFAPQIDLKNGYHNIAMAKGSKKLSTFAVPWSVYEWRENSFNRLKYEVENANIRWLYDPKLPLRVYTDASKVGVGDVLKRYEVENANIRWLYDPKLPLRVYTDASKVGVGDVLKRVEGDTEKTITYASRKFNQRDRTGQLSNRRLSDCIGPVPGTIGREVTTSFRQTKQPQSPPQGEEVCHRQFIRNYATIASPLIEMTAKQKSFVWKEPQEGAFKKLK
ncbi:hypothetical protein ADUPG1_012796, partial [Aduncisulcus paluster]